VAVSLTVKRVAVAELVQLAVADLVCELDPLNAAESVQLAVAVAEMVKLPE